VALKAFALKGSGSKMASKSITSVERLQKLGDAVTLEVYPGAVHDFDTPRLACVPEATCPSVYLRAQGRVCRWGKILPQGMIRGSGCAMCRKKLSMDELFTH
jgi:acetyl esterase/lipase